MDPVAVDLFCGVGGLTHGLEASGISVAKGIDIDPDCRYPYEENNDASFLEVDIGDLSSEEVNELYPENACKLLVGCAPCQPFSNYNNGKDSEEMMEWGLLGEFGRIVRDIQPSIVVMENVLEIRNHDVYSHFIDTLFKEGYDLTIRKVDCSDYGVPQQRKRLVVLGSTIGDIELIGPTHTTYEDRPTVRKTIGDGILPPIEAGEADDEDTLHRSQALSETNKERMQQSEPGGTWRDWDEELLLDCHKRSSGSSYQSVYGRMQWDKPAPTITTQFYGYGSGRFGHPEQNRAISLREGAMLQTFPEKYAFVSKDQDEIHYNQIGRLIGNAVPVSLAKAIGTSINNHLELHDVSNASTNRDGRRNALRNVSQSQRTESSGAEPL